MVRYRFAARLNNRRARRVTRGLGPAALLLLMLAEPGAAQNIVAYPSKGQSQEQQERDRFECYNWAVQQTGYNPQAAQAGTTAAPSYGGPTTVQGAGRGAAVGAIGGAIGGNAGKGAAIGAAAGGLMSGMRRREAERQQADMQYQQQQATAQQGAGFNRAMATCLQGRGYAVN